jgi:hypothetical protein
MITWPKHVAILSKIVLFYNKIVGHDFIYLDNSIDKTTESLLQRVSKFIPTYTFLGLKPSPCLERSVINNTSYSVAERLCNRSYDLSAAVLC